MGIIEPLLPKLPAGKRGRPWRDNREALGGILWVLRTGAPWQGLPKKYPPYQTCHRRFQRWSGDGTLEKVLTTITEKLENALRRKRVVVYASIKGVSKSSVFSVG